MPRTEARHRRHNKLTPSARSQRVAGLAGLAVGLAGLLTLKGIAQGMASCFIVLGLLFAVAPLPWKNRIKDRISIIAAIVGVVLFPFGILHLAPENPALPPASCHGHPTGGPQDIELQPYASQPGAAFSTPAGGTVDALTFPFYEWGGFHAAIPNYCSYTVQLQAREIGVDRSQDATGWGYGIGVCSTLTGGSPAGLSVQDNFEDNLKTESVFNQVLLPSPDENYGHPINVGVPIHDDWDRWFIQVTGDYWTLKYDGYTLISHELLAGASPLPKSCINSDLVIRVWGGRAEFRDVTLS